MAYNQPSRHSILPSSQTTARNSTLPSSTTGNSQTSQLQARVNAKRNELENLKQLQQLSSQLAHQMSTLETKLGTLRDGAEAVACVLQNWEGVMSAIGMASRGAADVMSRKEGEEERSGAIELPTTLVRIPVRREEDGDKGADGETNGG